MRELELQNDKSRGTGARRKGAAGAERQVGIKQLAAEMPETEIVLEYSPEAFSATELEFARDICDAVTAACVPRDTSDSVASASPRLLKVMSESRNTSAAPARLPVRTDRPSTTPTPRITGWPPTATGR